MEKINNPHDKYFKKLFGTKEEARSFLINYFPDEVKKITEVAVIDIDNTDYIDDTLKEFFSDIVYKLTIKGHTKAYLYVLIDHKSQESKLVAHQLSKYIVGINDKEKTNDTIPMVIPCVFYHGKSEWKIGRRLSDLIGEDIPEGLRKHLLDFEYLLVDVADFPDDEVKGTDKLILGIKVLKYILDTPKKLKLILKENRQLINRILGKEDGENFIELLTTYLMTSDLGVKSLKEVLEECAPGRGGTLVMSTYEKVKEEGKRERDLKIAKNMLEEGYNENSIAKVTELKIEEVQKLKQEMDSNS